MSTNENMSANAVSKSKQKRADRKKKNEAVKREGLIGAIIGILALVLIVGAIVCSIAMAALRSAAVVEPNSDFGKYITEAGTIQGVKAASIVTLPADYNSISVPKSEIEYTDEMFDEDVSRQLSNHMILDDDMSREIADGDKVNIDYVGSIDGVEFEGGNSGGEGSDLTIGSGMFIPGFEEQLIGHKTSDVFDIDVTFPEDYGNEELNGKAAVFNITVNGIYKLGEFTDSFVAENLKATGATTVAEYNKYLADNYEDGQFDQYIADYIKNNSSVSKFPSKYLKQLIALRMYSDQSSYEYMMQMYSAYGYGVVSFEEYTGMNQEEYQKSVDEACQAECTNILALQAIAEKEGISVNDDDIKAYIESMYGEGSYDSTLESYGKSYLAQETLQNKVTEFLKDNATVK